MVASEAGRATRSLAATCSAVSSTRNTFRPASFATSESVQPRRISSASSLGYRSTPSRPCGVSGMPSKSEPRPT